VKTDAVGDTWLAYYRSMTYYETQTRLLKSQSLAEKVVDKLELWKHPQFDPRQQPESRAAYPELAEFRKNFRWQQLMFWVEPAPQPEIRVDEKQLRISISKQLAGSVNPQRQGETDIIELYYQSRDPQLAADVVNAYAAAYIEMGLDNQLEMMQQAGFWLTEKMAELNQAARASEDQLQGFLERNDFMSGESGDQLADSSLSDVSSRLLEAQARYSNLEEEYKTLKNLEKLKPEELAVHPVVMSNPSIQEWKSKLAAAQVEFVEVSARYGPKHPKHKAAKREVDFAAKRLNTELTNAVAAATRELDVQQSKIGRLRSRLEGLKSAVQESNRKEFELRALRREVDVNRELYNAFLTKFKETNVSVDVSSSNAKVIDLAEVPTAAIAPNKKRIIAMASAAALMFAVGLVVLLEMLDATLKTGDDVEQRLGLPTLGTLQLLSRSQLKDRSPARFILQDRKSSFAESIRTIRSGVLLSSLDSPHKVVMITSTVPGEGKTTVAVNLALSLAQVEKVLLVDADMRRPSVGKYFELPKDRPGLSDFVAGSVNEEEAIYQDESGLSVIPAGVIPPNPSELLSSERFMRHIEEFSRQYDKVIIDSAPVQAVSDPIVISKTTTGVVYVIKSDATPYPLVQSAVRKLLRVNASIIGVVLNQQDTARSSRYYYYGKYGVYSRYGRYYDSYYHHDYYYYQDRDKA
jgi:capsular exopolysaccharide synthesis family protein